MLDFPISAVFRLYDLAVKAVRLSAVATSLEQYTEHIRNCACAFQLRYINYQFECSRLHKSFKDCVTNRKTDKEIAIAYDNLICHTEKGLKMFCGDLAEQIQSYFALTHKHRVKPRIGIHGINVLDEVVDIVMIPTASKSPPKKKDQYTVLKSICDTGLPYLANNLPQMVKSDPSYCHLGLDVNKIQSSYSPRILDKKFPARLRNNIWKKASRNTKWRQMAARPLNETDELYMSHLVVPITFRKHADSHKLSDRMVRILKLPEEGRSILGFVFVDHPATYYFDDGPINSYENIDINTLYLFADLLSLVFVTSITYTSGSETVQKYLSS